MASKVPWACNWLLIVSGKVRAARRSPDIPPLYSYWFVRRAVDKHKQKDREERALLVFNSPSFLSPFFTLVFYQVGLYCVLCIHMQYIYVCIYIHTYRFMYGFFYLFELTIYQKKWFDMTSKWFASVLVSFCFLTYIYFIPILIFYHFINLIPNHFTSPHRNLPLALLTQISK